MILKMKRNIITRFLCVAIFAVSVCTNAFADNKIAEFKSPDGSIAVQLFLDGNSALYYQVSKGSDQVISQSKLGINTSFADFSSGLTYDGSSSESVNESYTLPSGKKSTYLNNYNELKATFSNSGKGMQLIFRAYNDGVAYRYALTGSGAVSVNSESSECNVATKDQIYSQIYSRDYKSVVEESGWDRLSCLKYTSLPLMVKTNNNYVLISEAMVNGSYSASRLITNDETQSLAFQFAGSVNTSLPFQSPWRVMLIGSLNSMVESTLIDNLNPATTLTDISWIKPGRASWNYGGEDTSEYLSLGSIRKYIDWAKEMSWEYFTLDRGWQNTSAFTLDQVVSYANSKGIGLFIWVNQNKLPATESALRTVLQSWKNKGVKGLKVDFWENDSQATMAKYDLLLRLTSEQKLMLDFQSCTKPTGLRRTWPHLLTSEAVLSNAYYSTGPDVVNASHNINSAIIRGALGATDYNPVDFADKNGKILYGTSWAHQLALSVIFESGLQHIMDAPDNVRYNISAGFLKALPAAWDDTKCMDAEPDKHVAIARRSGENWYLASLTNEADTFETTLSFLSPDKAYNAYIYKDGNCPSEILFEYKQNLTSRDIIHLARRPNGGFAILFSPSNDFDKPKHWKFEAESADNLIPFGVSIKADNDSLCSNAKYVAGIGKGRSLTFRKIFVQTSGTYALTFYYTAETSTTAYVRVNAKDASWKEYSFNGTGTATGSGLEIKTVFVDLNAGAENIIEFGNSTDMAPNLDRIVISDFGNLTTGIEQIENTNKYGRIYAIDRNIILEQENITKYQIYNYIGQLVKSGTFNGGRLSVPVVHPGVYIVRMNPGKMDFSQKVIVK